MLYAIDPLFRAIEKFKAETEDFERRLHRQDINEYCILFMLSVAYTEYFSMSSVSSTLRGL